MGGCHPAVLDDRETDYHTGGEPFRIVAAPPVRIPGRTVAERRARAIEDPDVQALLAACAPNHGARRLVRRVAVSGGQCNIKAGAWAGHWLGADGNGFERW